MPSFLSRHGSNRLRRAFKAGDEGAAGRTGTAGSSSGSGSGSGSRSGPGTGGTGGDPKSSLVSFITVSNKSDSATSSLNKLQRSDSFKRRFGINNILTRGKNRTDMGQQQEGTVSSQVGDMRHRPAGSRRRAWGELEAVGSKDEAPPATSAQQQPSAQQQSSATATTSTTAAIVGLVRASSRKLSKPRPNNTSNTPARVIAPALSTVVPPAVSSVLSSPAEFSSQQQQQDGMAATTTMTSVMQQPKRRSFSLTLTVGELPRHISQASSSSPPPPIPQTPSRFNSYAEPPADEDCTFMLNSADGPYPSFSFLSPSVISNATGVGFSRPAFDNSVSAPQTRPSGPTNAASSGTISTPLGYYITPSQTPTLLDRSDLDSKSSPVPTVLRPSPSTPPPTEAPLSPDTDPKAQAQLQKEDDPSTATSGDRALNNGPPTSASSESSQKEKDPNRRVNFAEEVPIPSNSLVPFRGNVGNIYPNPPQQNRLGNYRPPGRPLNSNLRSHGPNQLPLRGPPRGQMLPRGPPRPPSPIYVPPPDMKDYKWLPLKESQLECSVGHRMVPFKNKQHSIVCMVCRSMEFEGRGDPVKRSFYCSWCAVRMCGDCKEELMSVCQGRLAELWDKTEEKRNNNMEMLKSGKQVETCETVIPAAEEQGPDQKSNEPFASRWDAAVGSAGEQGRSKTPQGIPDNTEDFPFPAQRAPPRGQRQLMISQPQQSRMPQQQHPRAPQPQQSRTPQPQQSRTPQPQQFRIPQPEKSRTPQPQQPRTLLPQQSWTPQQLRNPQPSDQRQQPPRQPDRGPSTPQKPAGYASGQATLLNRSTSRHSYPPPVPHLTLEETQKYRLVTVPSNQKPPSSGTVVLVDEKQEAPSIMAASLKGSVTKKKRNWLRGFGRKKEV